MTSDQSGSELLLNDVRLLEMIAHELEVAYRLAADLDAEINIKQYYTAQIPSLKERVNTQYQIISLNLQGIADSESAIARIAVRSILKNCGLGAEIDQ